MRRIALFGAAAALVVSGGVVLAQEGIGRAGEDGTYRTLTEGLKVIGGFDFSESCSYDPGRGVIVAPNMGNRVNAGFVNDGWVTLLNHDGSVHTLELIAGDDETGIWVNDPFGSDIVNGVLYLADRTGGTSDTDPSVAVVTMFDMATGEMIGMHSVPDSTGFNDLEVTDDGVIYASESSDPGRIFQVNPDGSYSVFLEGAPLARPNGVALDGDGNIVVVNIGDNAVLTFSPAAELLNTEHAVEGGNDGIVIMDDGTKYVSSVRFGSISRIAPGGTAEMIAVGMPGGASMCYDPDANQLVVPLNNANALVFVPLGM